nr:hypothetical protein 28Fp_00070 [Serratia proteamaculans]
MQQTKVEKLPVRLPGRGTNFLLKMTGKGGVISWACNEPHRDLILYTDCFDTGFYSVAHLVKG